MPPTTKLALATLDDVTALAKVLYDGGMQNKACNRPQALAARIVAGMEVGLTPVQAVNNILIVGGRAVIWGDGMLALVRASGLLEHFEERIEGEGDDRTAVCTVARKGDASPPKTHRFSVADAKVANLWEKAGPWTEYPDRQMSMRPRSWCLRDVFPDVLAGLGCAEEAIDVEVVSVRTNTPALPAAPPKPEKVSAETLAAIGEARSKWLAWLEVDEADKEAVGREWQGKLHWYGVTTAKDLTAEAAGRRLHELTTAPDFKPTEDDPGAVFGDPPAAPPAPAADPAAA